MTDDATLLKHSHFSSGFDAGKSLLEAENDRLLAIVGTVQVLFGKHGERFGMIHHQDCQVFGATVQGLDCDCGAQQVRNALARLGRPDHD